MTYVKATLLIVLLFAWSFAQTTKDGLGPIASRTKADDPAHPGPSLRIDVDQVLLYATVTDRGNRYVNGLSPENFRVWEDKIEQHIEYFSKEQVPLSVGIIFDVSGSMQEKLRQAQAAAATFLKMGDRDDEYFLIQFSDSPELLQDFTTDITKLQNRLLFAKAHGSTSLYDALYLGMNRVLRGTNTRKALLLITDGEDNHSRYSIANVKDFAKEHDVTIYSIGIEDASDMLFPVVNGRANLEALAELTGGVAFFPRTVDVLEDICQQIGLDLKNQYMLGYRSQNLAKDGKWRKVQVKVLPPKGLGGVTVRAKNGYYAPGMANAMK
jgi:Ca-activated chloride channel family protein